MPLPDTPDPEKSNVYRQLSSESIQTADVDNFDIVRFPVKLDPASEDELRRINLVGQAANLSSSSGPIPGTQVIKTVTVTDNSISTIFRPDPGEVWLWINWRASTSGQGGATINHYTYLSDGSNNDALSVITAASTTPKNETPYSAIYVTNEVYASVQSLITTGSVVWLSSFIRVR